MFLFSSLCPITIAENLGFTSYPPAYLSKEAAGKNLLIGANFASASSGYYDSTAKLYVNTMLINQKIIMSFYQMFFV